MAPIKRRGTATRRDAVRRSWLAAHPERMLGVPGLNEDVTDQGRMALDLLRAVMLEHELFGVNNKDQQRDTIRRLVSELRGEHVVGGDW